MMSRCTHIAPDIFIDNFNDNAIHVITYGVPDFISHLVKFGEELIDAALPGWQCCKRKEHCGFVRDRLFC